MTTPKINQTGYFDPKLASKNLNLILLKQIKVNALNVIFSENEDIEIYDVVNIGTITRIKATIYN